MRRSRSSFHTPAAAAAALLALAGCAGTAPQRSDEAATAGNSQVTEIDRASLEWRSNTQPVSVYGRRGDRQRVRELSLFPEPPPEEEPEPAGGGD